ncbi:MAG: FliA/WhiG family RNA polymerase sigma factor [Planctomycetes bacterium]|nr:FliA/WhiG family RNA polymerase sigma factor [Planctomycetota bacterium]
MSSRATSLVPEDMLEVWKTFKAKPTEEGRNELMEYYLRIVKYTADRLHSKLPSEVEKDDLISAGVFGLIDAINSFDLARGVKFETYCVPRIRGAILDELRSIDWVPRLVRSRAHKLDDAVRSLEMELGRRATVEELAKQMHMSISEMRKLQRDAQAVGLVSLNRKWFETDSNKDIRELDMLEDKRVENPLLKAQGKDIRELITRGLNRAERLIIVLYYYEQMTMKEIGETLDLSESRVSQMHSAILDRLKTQLTERQKELQT